MARHRRRLRRLTLLALGLVGGLVVWHVGWRLTCAWRAIDVVQIATPDSPASRPGSPGELRVLAYNIAHGRGLSVSNWNGEEEVDRRDRLQRIAAFIESVEADVVVLNEVDLMPRGATVSTRPRRWEPQQDMRLARHNGTSTSICLSSLFDSATHY